ncbi:MAG: transcriptional regulator [Bacteroidetes bacterium RIFOXYA12_FULL_35_11]|nr:MAG: transcriptional regulator [Bacteroidetes bacterium GWF2_35_48]OFY75331.1 MAG: transcriptional regulator [Bacteroidetes bacterium RIFOXYA12_FULL_35_11]OFY94828.1 MAG: transcriptional regulator [Bacteroidetes bacterium RIFOXYC12_FULL_35_7]OFY96910.1 MAG: transcriptional regulator [Bacteroidetes bacterium RIFOXYB2_FULL_35_7]HBX53468.1 transcriptional regulator [Bacteroidales bacterium]
MHDIKMVDLKGQYLKIKEEVDAAIAGVIENTSFINGPDVKAFQSELEKYLGVKHVIPCANGTDALQIALMALNLQPGDEVITSDFTFIATVEVIKLLRLKPVLVDVYPDTFNIDIEKLEKAITEKTKAIIPVHLFGQCTNMTAILSLAKKHNLFVIEDTAQAIGSQYFFPDGRSEFAGNMGNIACTSFFPSKNLGCFGDGGAMYTNDDDLAARLRLIVNHGMKTRYYYDDIGVNSRLDSIQAALLRVKLKYLDQYNKARQKAASFYDTILGVHPKIQIPSRSSFSTHTFHQYTIVANGFNRDELRLYLEKQGIPAMIYYPVPLHIQKAYADCGFNAALYPVTDNLCKNVLSLPMHTELSEEQLLYITNHILKFLQF